MRVLRKLLEQVEKDNRQHALLKRGESLVVGLSGGPDSTALLFILSKLQRKYGWKILAAHLNHGFARAQARRHALAAKRAAERLHIPFRLKTVSCRVLAKRRRRSLEETGRVERYRFFEEVARRARASKIVTAHTLDDQAETVLLRMLRGSGLRGLAAIPRKRAQGPFEVARPLLGCEKKDLLRMLREERQPFAVDATNESGRFTRNRVRRTLLPLLEKHFNPRARHVLASLQSVCEEAQAHLERAAAAALRRCLARPPRHGARVTLVLTRVRRLPRAVLREMLCQAVLVRKGDLNRLSHEHIAAVTKLALAREARLETHLPGPLLVRKEKDLLHLV